MFGATNDKSMKLMRSTNPMVIPRNHKIEESLMLADDGDLSLFNKVIEILKNPYNANKGDLEFMSSVPYSDKKYKTFCGT
jgi:uncharacterized protein YdiU (UPF0061 family)